MLFKRFRNRNKKFAGHSLRSGFATTTAEYGAVKEILWL